MNIKTLKIFTILNMVTMLVSGCINYPIYDFAYFDYGIIASLITDWKERGKNIDIPERYTVKIGDYINTLAGTNNPIDYLFPPGKYIINIWNVTHHISISEMLATADYTAGELGWFFTGRKEVMIELEREHSFIVYMQQQVRQLTFELEIADNVRYLYSDISATLSGVAGTLNMDDGMHGAPTTIALSFTENPDGSKWKATVRLLGIAGKSQILILTMNFDDVDPSFDTITSDLSNQLTSFNEDKKTPLTLSTRIEGTQTDGVMIATITDWISEETSTGTAD